MAKDVKDMDLKVIEAAFMVKANLLHFLQRTEKVARQVQIYDSKWPVYIGP